MASHWRSARCRWFVRRQPQHCDREPSTVHASRRWHISLLKATPAKYVGYVRALDAKSAIEMAAKDYKISDRLVDRLIATPEE
jgi:hypothetical protein